MNFFLLGIDHKTAPIDVRENVYGKRAGISAFWESRAPGSTAVLVTCNRFEIYSAAASRQDAKTQAAIFKNSFKGLFEKGYFVYGSDGVFHHIGRLAAGLESQIIGEGQIYAQLNDWAGREGFPGGLGRIVHEALILGHEIKSAAGFKAHENNIATIIYKYLLARHDSDDLLNVAVAGTGKVAELFARYKPKEARLYFAAHKNIARARELARQSDAHALLLKSLPELLLKADVLISAASSPHRIFDKDYFSRITALREKELYVYDLAVPRSVDPESKEVEGIVLNDIDSLSGVFEEHNRSLEVIIDEANFKNRYASKPAGR